MVFNNITSTIFAGCPNCVVFTTDTNFSSILSFESKVLVGAKNSIYEIDFSEEISTQYSDQVNTRVY